MPKNPGKHFRGHCYQVQLLRFYHTQTPMPLEKTTQEPTRCYHSNDLRTIQPKLQALLAGSALPDKGHSPRSA